MIPLVDLVAQYHTIQAEIDAAVREVLEKGHFILGPQVTAFEQEIAEYLNVRHAVGVASGTDALVIALRAIGVGPGDEVIVPAYTFFATAGAVMLVGAKPVFVDIYPDTYCLDVQQVAERITPKTKAIIPVHLYGHPADMAPLLDIAHMRGLKVIEDNAQAFGAEYRGRKTGSLGDIGCLSFFPTKNLGGYGDGGMVVTNEDEFAARLRMLRAHGWKKKYFPEMLGYNSRLDELQAAILRVKLRHVDAWNDQRRAIAQRYTERLSAMGIVTPQEDQQARHVYHLYTVRFAERDRVQSALKNIGVASDVYYPRPPHLADPCRPFGYRPGDFPVAEQASRETLSIPLYPEMTDKQVSLVLEAVQKVQEKESA
ncbi:MAG TPA: DegT/DnrJ/EryC1/StrS family aminotransferase [Anaerolineales bacterium]|nr:DegT/DnrJ/EryC1/StrS family aminotransferase [Anaerolineales bacterium]